MPRIVASDFPEETLVSYVPLHAKGDVKHKDVEHGVVVGNNTASDLVFVRFGGDTTPKACRPETLVKKEEVKDAPAAATSPSTATAPGAAQGGTTTPVVKT